MNLTAVTPEAIQAALVFWGATWAALIFIHLAPGLQRHAARIRVAILILYVLGFAGFVLYALLR